MVSFDVFAYSTLLLHVKVKLKYKKNGYHTALLIVKLHIVSFLPRSLSIDNIRHDVTYLSTWLLHERWRKKTTYIYQYIYLWYMYSPINILNLMIYNFHNWIWKYVVEGEGHMFHLDYDVLFIFVAVSVGTVERTIKTKHRLIEA